MASTFRRMRGKASRTSSKRGTTTPRPRYDAAPEGSRKRAPASKPWISRRVRSATRPRPSVVRSTVSSWMTTTSPSRVRRTSISSMSAR